MPQERFNDINTDEILSGPYMRIPEEELKYHAFEGIIDNFYEKTKNIDILIAGSNTGCGSSREQAPKALLGCGIKMIIAPSFGYIFSRNSMNLGLILLRTNDIDKVKELADEELTINPELGIITGSSGRTVSAEPLDRISLDVISAGGLMLYLKNGGTFDNKK
jgi:3-isopropylmalate/(R)-2-methylmalate dehydratase small subunit